MPNILLITSDQHHFSALGATCAKLSTPNLDRLCVEGTRFKRAYCTSPVCSPSRSTILTGQYPSSHGCWTIGTKLAEDVPTVSRAFADAGFFTALIGKAHFQPLRSEPDQTSLETPALFRDLDFWKDFTGPWYGFEHVQINRNHADEFWAGQHYGLWLKEKGVNDWERYFAGGGAPEGEKIPRRWKWDLPEALHYGEFVAEKSIDAIEAARTSERPFFLWASFADPHPPYLVPEPFDSMYSPGEMEPGTLLPGELDAMPPHFAATQEPSPDFSAWAETGWGNHGFHSHLTSDSAARKNLAVYFGMISLMDKQIGKILRHLDATGLADDTIVVFTTDHGHFLGQHGLWHKGAFHYEDLLKIPFLVRWPGHVPAGATSDALQSLVDLAPTFLDCNDWKIPGVMQGVSQRSAWEGDAVARSWSLTEFRHQPTKLHLRTLVTDRYKITLYRGHEFGELFDLASDPEERRNLWDEPSAATVKTEMLAAFVRAEMEREPTRFPRIAHA